MAKARSKAASGNHDFELLAAFRYALRQFLRFSEQAARSQGLTPQQHQALLAVRGFPGGQITIGELAERLQIRHHSAVGMVDRLTAMGLATRAPAAEDRRKVHIVLSARGAKTLDALAAVHRDELRRLGPQLRTLMDQIGRPRRRG
jgi:DNA-binding MarR family transcriptional regulator